MNSFGNVYVVTHFGTASGLPKKVGAAQFMPHKLQILRRMSQFMPKAKKGTALFRQFLLLDIDYTSSMMAISAASPRRAPMRTTLV